MTAIDTVNGALPQAAGSGKPDAALMDTARKLEASFLSEMLKSAGFGEGRNSFGGGIGEDQFASFLRLEHANALVRQGGVGLAESLFHALKDRNLGRS